MAIFNTPNPVEQVNTSEHWSAEQVCCDAMVHLLQQDVIQVVVGDDKSPYFYRILLAGNQMTHCPYCPAAIVIRKD